MRPIGAGKATRTAVFPPRGQARSKFLPVFWAGIWRYGARVIGPDARGYSSCFWWFLALTLWQRMVALGKGGCPCACGESPR